MTKENYFFINLIKFSVPTFFTLFVGIVAIPILSRVYPTAEYGKINLFYTIGNVIYMVALVGLDSAYIRFFYEPREKYDKNEVFKLALSLGVLISIFLFSFTYVTFLDEVLLFLFGEKNIIAFLFLFIFVVGQIIFRMETITSRMNQNSRLYSFEQISMTFFTRIFFVVVTVFSTYYMPSIAFISISTIFVSCYFFIANNSFNNFKKISFPNSKITLNLLAYAFPLMPSSLLLWLNNSVAKIILTSSGDFDALGIYAMASSIAFAFAAIPGAFGTYWSPFIYENYEKEQTMIKNVHDYIMIFSIFICIMIIVFQDFIFMILGVNYRSSQPYFMMLLFSPLATLISETTSYGISIAKKTHLTLYISLVACLLNLVICKMLFSTLGVIGVALGGTISAIFQLFLQSIIGQKFYRSINSYSKSLFFSTIIFVLCFLNIYLSRFLVTRYLVCLTVFLLTAFSYLKELIKCKDKIIDLFSILHKK
ncbi:MAG: hypothetical protein CVV54_04760 [Synergistetes bacterium HGW-Synergistetes-1]|nr:MAG: hypothetical protein CVV54_04760 [Synergistetes bacterium HGW-Synergistetes-1]